MAVAPAAQAGARRVMYGLNSLFQAVLVFGVLVLLVYFAQRFGRSWDWSRTGVNSLSPSTANLLSHLNEKVTITAAYGVDRKSDVLGEKRLGMIRDLLSLYDLKGGANVDTYVIDPQAERARIEKMLIDLRDKPGYKEEWQPHKAVIDKAAPLADAVLKLVTADLQTLDGLMQKSAGLRESQGAAQARAILARLQREADNFNRAVAEMRDATMPIYGESVKQVSSFANLVKEGLKAELDWAGQEQRTLATADIELKEWLTRAPERMQQLVGEAEALAVEASALKPPKLDDVGRELNGRSPIIVETAKEAFVVPFSDVWPMKFEDLQSGGDQDLRNFAGEAAVSSAILRLTQKDKTGVIFVRYGGEPPFTFDEMAVKMAEMQGRLPNQPPFAQLNQDLKRSNFETADWDVKAAKTPPEVEGATRKIFVVFPPEPPDQRNRMRAPNEGAMTAEDAKLVTDAVEASGLGIFMTGWMPGAMTMPGEPAAAGYPYAAYLQKTWGITCEVNHLIIPFTPNPEKEGRWVPRNRDPLMIASPEDLQLTRHEIGRNSLPVAMRMACPLILAKGDELPSGVRHEVIAEVPRNEDTWAVKDPNSLTQEFRSEGGTSPKETSIRTPFAAVVAALRKDGEAEKKVIVFDSQEWSRDQVAHATVLVIAQGAVVPAEANPGNTDLMVNSLHWLTGNADRIAVGPRSTDVPRLAQLKDGWPLNLSRAFMVGIWPGLALAAGLVVSFFRRR